MELRKLYMADGVAKDFDYAQAEADLAKLEANIKNIQAALDKKIEVTSYTGDAQAEVTAAVDSIRTYLATMEEPLNKIRAKIQEVKEAYAASEASIKSALSDIANQAKVGNTTNYLN